uniref:Uncharacterized protein n=1 Tax=Sphaerodactylus townsendi TaxID=933632 RepID=A0ACB8F1B6_9SAUR
MVGRDSNDLGILGCQPTGFRSLRNGHETGVDAICTYRYDSTTPTFDRVKMYGEIVNRTQNFTKTGPYLLDRDSLYVNGFHGTPPPTTVLPTTTTTASPGTQNFTVNFTITSLKYRSEMGVPNSRTFSSTARVVSRLLHQMVRKDSNEAGSPWCQPTGFRSVRNGNETGVDAICTYRYDSTTPTFDRVKMYGEIVNRTQNFTKTGPYLLDRDSLYVNGFHETPPPTTVLPTTTTTASPGTQNFMVNFTITSLKYRSEMGVPNSRTFSSTARVVSRLLHQMVGKDSNELGILGCQPTGFRSLRNGNETGVDAICTYRYDSTTPTFDRVKMYGEIVNRTQNFTKIGPYLLERDSLYVNGFHEIPPTKTVLPTTTTTPSPGIQDFTVNFTITSLTYRSEMGVRNSRRFNSTARSVSKVLHQTIEASSDELTILGCQATSFRSLEDGDHTGVDAICTYRKDSPTDRKKMYHGIVNTTNGFTRMGPYQVDQNSLYVNATTTKTQTLGYFTVNCTFTNLVIQLTWEGMDPGEFSSTERGHAILYGTHSKGTSIGPAETGTGVTMDALCSYQKNLHPTPFDHAKVQREMSEKTNGGRKMERYDMQENSLRVNGNAVVG